jgi:ABC-type transport system involved in multi-copper enzyme maturation permease subunit
MNSPSNLSAMRWLVLDTFRQSVASSICWLMLAVSGLCILVCLSVGVAGNEPLDHPGDSTHFLPRNDPGADPARLVNQGVDVVKGDLTLAFGAVKVPLGRDGPDAVRFLQLLLAGFVADSAGLVLILVWTAGFLPSFLEPSAAAVLLAKPVPRWILLVGKYVGVLAFVLCQALFFVVGTWVALGLRTDIWNFAYLLCIPVLLLHFAIFFSFSTLLAVCTRSTMACIFGSILFWLMCLGMNYGRHVAVALPYLDSSATDLAGSFGGMVEVGYWIMPKPADMGIVLAQLLQATGSFATVPEFEVVLKQGHFDPLWSIVSSLLCAVVLLGIAVHQFMTTDY